METEDRARIYVGDYASYNNGFLYGKWLDLDGKTADEIRSDIAAILKENSQKLGQLCEEPMFQDYEGFPREFYDESWLDFDRLVQYLELDEHERDQVRAYLQFDPSPEAALENYQDVVIWESFRALVDELPIWDEVPEQYHFYIDIERLERDIRIEGTFIDLEDSRVAEILV